MAFGLRRANSNRLAALLAAVAAVALSGNASAHKYKFHTIYSFCAETNCTDGGLPEAALLMDASGNLYGTTTFQGTSGQSSAGTVFELIPDGTKWKRKTLYSFCAKAACTDGRTPLGSLIVDMAGDLYGTTQHGGSHDAGVVFELTPNATRNKWKYKRLHDFCGQGGDICADGNLPYAGLTYAGAASGAPYDGTSTLYGTTGSGGGPTRDGGTAFSLRPDGNKWKQRVLYAFCALSQCTDGAGPHSALVMDSKKNLYGTTVLGGSTWFPAGVAFKLTTGGSESVLYAFCPSGNCPDGDDPQAPLLLDPSGDVLGTTHNGGANGGGLADGTVFKISGTQEQVVYNFCALQSCADGAFPTAGLIMDQSGNMFGTTAFGGGLGGGQGGGTVFQINGATEQVLHAFCSKPSCADGELPGAGLIMDASGNLFGTTEEGGANGLGTVFELEF